MVYGLYGNANRWSIENIAISMQRRSDGIPILRSGYAILLVGSTSFNVDEVSILITKDCQKERKMTSLIAATLRNG